MKKVFAVMLLFSLVFIMVACEPEMYFFDKQELLENTKRVELINYCTYDIYEIDSEDEILPFDFEKMEVLETLEPSKYNDFFQELSDIQVHYDLTYSNTSLGISLKITYKNDNFVVISGTRINDIVYGGVTHYNAQGEVIDFYGQSMYLRVIDLVNQFFEIEIDS